MDYIIIIYSLLSFVFLLLFAKISYRLKLVDLPNERKIHTSEVAFTGGIIISLIFIVSSLLFDLSNKEFNSILSMSFLIAIIGLIDDKFNLSVGSKLSLQIFPIFYLIVFQDLALHNLGDYFYFEIHIQSFTIPITMLCALFLINAFNYFDGIDGTLSFSSISVLMILFFLIPDQEFQLFLKIILIPIIIFLCFNFSLFKLPKMFLGDSGSLLLGFLISFILIYLNNYSLIHPILLAWTIVIFVYEFLSINIIRIKNNKNPFKADQDHLHHILYKKTRSIFLTNFFITFMNVILFLIGYLSFLFINSIASLFLFLFLFVVFFTLRNKYTKTSSVFKI